MNNFYFYFPYATRKLLAAHYFITHGPLFERSTAPYRKLPYCRVLGLC